MLWLAWWYLLIPDPVLFLGVTGTEAFLTIEAVEDRVFDGRVLGIGIETFLGAARAVRAGFFQTIAALDGPGACVWLPEAGTLPVEEPAKIPDAVTTDPANRYKLASIYFNFRPQLAWWYSLFVDSMVLA